MLSLLFEEGYFCFAVVSMTYSTLPFITGHFCYAYGTLMCEAVYNSFYTLIVVVFYSLSTPCGLGACDTGYLNQSFNQSLCKYPCVTCVFSDCVPVRCWHGPVPKSTASFMPVRAEWPCQPRATNRMSRLRATQCLFQAEVSVWRKLCNLSKAEMKITMSNIKILIKVHLMKFVMF